MSSGSTGTWSRNSSISCAVVPTTSGIAGSAAAVRRRRGGGRRRPRGGTASCRPSPARPSTVCSCAASSASTGSVAQVVDATPRPAASRNCSADPRRRRRRRACPRARRSAGWRPRPGGRRSCTRRGGARCAPDPADSPISTMRSGSPPNAPTLARNHSTAAAQVAQRRGSTARRRPRASRARRGGS